MNPLEDPVRLAVGGSPRSRELLRSAGLDEPSPQALERLAARLGPALAPPATAASGGAATWLAIAAAGVIGVAGVVWWALPAAPPQPAAVVARAIAPAPAAPAPALPVPPAPAPVPSMAPAVVATVPAPDAPAHGPARPAGRRPARSPVAAPAIAAPPTAPVAPAPAVAAAEPRPREIDLLDQAREALGGDPRRSLALAARHEELYPNGSFVEEREDIRIEAMLGLGQLGQARARFDRFVERFPRSVYRSPLQRHLLAADQ